MTTQYDAVVIGTGQAGPSLAAHLAGADMSVAVVERHRFGATCVNTGCTPTKALVASSRVAHVARRASHFGVVLSVPVSVDMKWGKARDFRAQVRAGGQIGPLFDVVEATDGATDLRRITNPEQVHDVYMRLSRLPELVEVVAGLLDGAVRVDHAKLNFKAETDSSPSSGTRTGLSHP